MRATTVKVGDELLEELIRTKPPGQTLTAYVRSLLQCELQRRRMVQAADDYAAFLRRTPDERRWLDEWDTADLARAPRTSRRR
jgi:hypothetical protein